MFSDLLSTFSLRLFKKIISYLNFRDQQNLTLVCKQISDKVFAYYKEDLQQLRVPHLNSVQLLHDINVNFERLKKLKLLNIQLESRTSMKQYLSLLPKTIVYLQIGVSCGTINQPFLYDYITKYNNQLEKFKIKLNQRYNNEQFLKIQEGQVQQFLLKMTHLSEITIKGTNSSDVVQTMMFKMLHFSKVEKAYFENIHLDGFYYLIRQIKKITLKFNQIDLKGLQNETLLRLIQILPKNMEEITIIDETNNFQEISFDILKQFLFYFKTLSKLNLNKYSSEYVVSLSNLDELAPLFSNLHSLGISSFHFEPTQMFLTFSKLEKITELKLDFVDLIDDHLIILSEFAPNIQLLSLRGCKRISKSALVQFFSKTSVLKILNLRQVIYASKAVFRVIIQKNNHMKCLKLDQNKLDNQTFFKILTKYQYSLEDLVIGQLDRNDNFTEEVFEIMKKKNIKLVNVKKLQVSGNQSFGLTTIKNILEIFPYLRQINLKYLKQIPSKDVLTLLVSQKRYLESIALVDLKNDEKNFQQEEFLQTLANTINSMVSLNKIILYITQKDMEKLQKLLQRNISIISKLFRKIN